MHKIDLEKFQRYNNLHAKELKEKQMRYEKGRALSLPERSELEIIRKEIDLSLKSYQEKQINISQQLKKGYTCYDFILSNRQNEKHLVQYFSKETLVTAKPTYYDAYAIYPEEKKTQAVAYQVSPMRNKINSVKSILKTNPSIPITSTTVKPSVTIQIPQVEPIIPVEIEPPVYVPEPVVTVVPVVKEEPVAVEVKKLPVIVKEIPPVVREQPKEQPVIFRGIPFPVKEEPIVVKEQPKQQPVAPVIIEEIPIKVKEVIVVMEKEVDTEEEIQTDSESISLQIDMREENSNSTSDKCEGIAVSSPSPSKKTKKQKQVDNINT